MSKRTTIATITGIRPDFIRMSEVFKKLDKHFTHILIHSGQHFDRSLSDVFFQDLEIREPDINLGIGGHGITHHQQVALLGDRLLAYLRDEKLRPDLFLFLGDSNSALASVPLKKEGFRVGHIEAGMRSGDDRMLEETNRKVCDALSNVLFAYHPNNKRNLVRENKDPDCVYVVGNTIVEPISRILSQLDNGPVQIKHICMDIHRPENYYKDRLETIIRRACQYSWEFGYPIKMVSHPRTLQVIEDFGIQVPEEIEIMPLMGFKDFVQFQRESLFIFSDSGTAQEEPGLLGKYTISPRDYNERPESILASQSYKLFMDDSSYRKSVYWLRLMLESGAPDCSWLYPPVPDRTTSEMIIEGLEDFFVRENSRVYATA